jgi:hypothetical protein
MRITFLSRNWATYSPWRPRVHSSPPSQLSHQLVSPSTFGPPTRPLHSSLLASRLMSHLLRLSLVVASLVGSTIAAATITIKHEQIGSRLSVRRRRLRAAQPQANRQTTAAPPPSPSLARNARRRGLSPHHHRLGYSTHYAVAPPRLPSHRISSSHHPPSACPSSPSSFASRLTSLRLSPLASSTIAATTIPLPSLASNARRGGSLLSVR